MCCSSIAEGDCLLDIHGGCKCLLDSLHSKHLSGLHSSRAAEGRATKGAWQVQVRSLMGQVRPDRQTLLFTATMPTKVDNLVRDCLTTPVRITVGEIGAANQDIKQARSS